MPVEPSFSGFRRLAKLGRLVPRRDMRVLTTTAIRAAGAEHAAGMYAAPALSMRHFTFVPIVRRLLAPVIAAACVAACGSSSGASDAGGSVADGDAATTGDAATGTDSSNPVDASTAPDGLTGCPPSEPGIGSTCSAVSGICSYGGGLCCGGAFACSTDGTWQVVEATCACTAPAPDAGGPCGGHTCDTGTSCCGPPECGICISNQSGIACATSCDGGGGGNP
jgi:hypothetical protein